MVRDRTPVTRLSVTCRYTIACRPKPKKIDCRIVKDQPATQTLADPCGEPPSIAAFDQGSTGCLLAEKNFPTTEYRQSGGRGAVHTVLGRWMFAGARLEPGESLFPPIFPRREPPARRVRGLPDEPGSTPGRPDFATPRPTGNRPQSARLAQPRQRSDPHRTDPPARFRP